MSESKLNPMVREFEVGSRELRTIKIYPLSIGDQNKMGSVLVEAIKMFADKANIYGTVDSVQAGLDNVGIIAEVIDLITVNLSKILTLASDVPQEEMDEVVDSMTNMQLTEIVEGIWDMNYEGSVKNVQNLIQRIKGQRTK